MAREKGIYILMIKLNEFIFFFALQYFLKEIFRVIETLVKVWENFKKKFLGTWAAGKCFHSISHSPKLSRIGPRIGSRIGSQKKKEKNPKEKKIKSFIR